MQKFSGSFDARVGYTVMALMFLLAGFGGPALVVYQTHIHAADPTPFLTRILLSGLCLVLFGGMGVLSLFGVLETLTEYEVGPDQLTRRSKFKTISMRWRDVARLDEGGTSKSTMTLADVTGRKLKVDFSFVSDREGKLRAAILESLAPLRARQSADFAAREHVLRSAAWAKWFLLVVGLLSVVGGAVIFRILPGADFATRAVLGGFVGALGLLLAFAAVYSFSWRLTFSSQELRLSTLFFTRRIPLHQIESVYVYETTQKDQTFQFLKVAGNGVKITVGSQTPHYPFLREALLKAAPAESIQIGEQTRAEFLAKQKRIAVHIMAVCLTLLAGIFGWLGWGLRQKVVFIDTLAKRGITTTATITGRDCGCDNSGVSDAQYRFTVAGKTYTGENSLKAYRNVRLVVNQQTVVRYLPENPSRNRLQVCMDWRPPIRNLLLPLGVQSLLFVPLIGYGLARKAYQKRKAARAASRTDAVAQGGADQV